MMIQQDEDFDYLYKILLVGDARLILYPNV